MTTSRSQSPYGNTAAKLPALPTVRITDPQMQRFVDAIRAWVDTRDGSRDKFERVVTMRDLVQLGIIDQGDVTRAALIAPPAGGGSLSIPPSVLVETPGGRLPMSIEAFAKSIFDTVLFRDMMRRLDDPARFDRLPEQIRSILLRDIAEEAAARGADIRRIEFKQQQSQESLAYTVDEVTASVTGSMAGVRETVYAYANEVQASAGKITQVQARLDAIPVDPESILPNVYGTLAALVLEVPVGIRGKFYQVDDPDSTDNFLYAWNGEEYYLAGKGTTAGGGTATVEQQMTAIADRNTGLEAQYTLKVQAGRAIAGFGLAATEIDGVPESAFIIQADKFALTSGYDFAQESTPTALAIGDTWYKPSTRVSYRATAVGTANWVEYVPIIPFGVDMENGTVYINGDVRINTGNGTRLNDVGEGESNIIVYAYRRTTANLTAADRPSATATYDFTTKVLSGLSNSWTNTIPAGSDPLWVIAATAASTTGSDTLVTADWTTPVILAQDGEAAAAGANSGVAYLYRRTATGTPPAKPTGSTPANDMTYTFATGALTGTTPADWSVTIPASGGDYLWESRAVAFATGGTDTILPSEWSDAFLFSQNGAVGGSGKSTYNAVVYTRFSGTPAAPITSTGSFNFGDNTITVPDSALPGSYTWSATVPAGTTPVWASMFLFSITGDIGIAPATVWTTPVKYTETGPQGAAGKSTYLYPVYVRSATSPSVPTGGLYNFGTNSGEPPATPVQWHNAPPTGDNQLFMSVSTAVGDTPTSIDDTLSWSGPVPVANRGSRTLYSTSVSPPVYSSSANPWDGTADDNLAAKIVWQSLGNSAGSFVNGTTTHLTQGDTVTLRNSAGNKSATRTWAGLGAWIDPGVIIDGNLIVNGTISGTKILANTITAGLINSTGLSIKNSAGAVILDAGTGQFSGETTGPLSGNLTGTLYGTPASTVVAGAASGDSAWGKFTGVGQTLPSGAVEFNFAAGATKNGNAINTNAVGSQTAGTVQSATINFNGRNDRNNVTPVTPTVANSTGTLDHVANADGSVDLSFEWSWSGNVADIDGFVVYAHDNGTASPSSQKIFTGAANAAETVYYVTPERRAIIIYGVAADHFYTFGVQAYRIVDNDITSSGVLKSSIAQPLSGATETTLGAYRPSSSVSFSGNVTGTVDGTSAAIVRSGAAQGQTAINLVNDPTNGLSTKISNSGTTILNGVLRSQLTTSPNGIVTGDLAWTADGAYVSGRGVAMMPLGLVGHNGTKLTFTINASDGNAYFYGDVVGATITGGVIRTSESGQRVVINESSTNEINVWANTGSVVENTVKIGLLTGQNYGGFSTSALAQFGTGSSTRTAVAALSGTGVALYSQTGGGIAFHAQSTGATVDEGTINASNFHNNAAKAYAVAGFSQYGHGGYFRGVTGMKVLSINGSGGTAIDAVGAIKTTGTLTASGVDSSSGWSYATISAGNFAAIHHGGANAFFLGYYSNVQRQHIVGSSNGTTLVNNLSMGNMGVTASGSFGSDHVVVVINGVTRKLAIIP